MLIPVLPYPSDNLLNVVTSHSQSNCSMLRYIPKLATILPIEHAKALAAKEFHYTVQ